MKKRRNTGIFRAICALLTISVVLVIVDIKLRPILIKGVGNAVENQITIILHNALGRALEDENIEYNDLVTLEKSSSGSVTAVTANTLAMNRLKTALCAAAANAVGDAVEGRFRVPLGTLTDSPLLSGRGPNITVHITLSGAVTGDFLSAFESAGINQTRHSIDLKLKVRVQSYAGTYRVGKTVEMSFPIAETVLLGTVPEVYLSY